MLYTATIDKFDEMLAELDEKILPQAAKISIWINHLIKSGDLFTYSTNRGTEDEEMFLFSKKVTRAYSYLYNNFAKIMVRYGEITEDHTFSELKKSVKGAKMIFVSM